MAVILIVTQIGGTSGNQPVNAGDVHGQIDGIKQLINDNTK